MKAYAEKLKDPRWQKKRLEVLSRDDWACVHCGETRLTLHVHHLKYTKGEPWDISSEYLETLCKDCHNLTHQKLPEIQTPAAKKNDQHKRQHKGGLLVVKHNLLIEGRYRLSLDEMRLLLLAISKLDSRSQQDSPRAINVTAREFSDIYGSQLKQSYSQLRAAVSGLGQQKVAIKNTSPVCWLSTNTYNDGEGSVTLDFSLDIKPYLSQLDGMFTCYKLSCVAQLKTPYSIRLYELLSQWRGTGKRIIKVAELRSLLVLEDKYEKFSDLRKCVIEPAIKELNTKTDLQVTFSTQRKGRFIAKLLFSFMGEETGMLEA